jgi:hypothetical protein
MGPAYTEDVARVFGTLGSFLVKKKKWIAIFTVVVALAVNVPVFV